MTKWLPILTFLPHQVVMTLESDAPVIEFTPRSFGRYYLIDKIAVGGMAEVFKAVFLGLRGFEMQLVIKRILPHLSADEDFVEMFVKEAKICVELRHHNIVQIYEFSRFNEHYFIAMEHVDGKDLKQFLLRLTERKRRISIEQAICIAHEICRGLDYAHHKSGRNGESLEIVHRDLTPANIILSYAGEVKIADFGIAKAKGSAKITKAGALKGKYEYMSPEQARGEEVDSRSDIFAVGIVLHEMLTGRRLFKTDSETATLEKVRAVDILEPIQINPRISPRLNQIVMRCLHPSRSARFQNAKSLQKALLSCLRPLSLSMIEDQLAETLQELFEKDRKLEYQRERQHKERARELQSEWNAEEIDLLQEEDLQLDSVLPHTPPNRGLFVAWGSVVALLIVLGIQTTADSPRETIVNRKPPTNLVVTVHPSDTNGRLFFNGEEQGRGSSFRLENIQATSSLLTYKSEGHHTWEQNISLLPNETHHIFITVEKNEAD